MTHDPIQPAELTHEDLDYRLPDNLIAQQPIPQRDHARLLVVDRAAETITDSVFTDLPRHLNPGDLLVLNDTKVLPARIFARRPTGGRVGGLFLSESDGIWELFLNKSARLKVGQRLTIEGAEPDASLELVERRDRGLWRARLISPHDTPTVLHRAGWTALPPYIHRRPGDKSQDHTDRARYQTTFAANPGAVAAPTASLHFTDRVFGDLDELGVRRATLTLHVGPGTFAPIKTPNLDQHPMHAERFHLPAATAQAVRTARRNGNRIIAAGTTTVRVLEHVAHTRQRTDPPAESLQGWTDLFIKPPFEFQAVDILLTNFHLPNSTLLALVMTFAGRDLIKRAYAHAVEHRYRFFSFGDAMLIL